MLRRALAQSFSLPLRRALPDELKPMLPTFSGLSETKEAALSRLDEDERKISGFDALTAALKTSASVGADAANSDLMQAGQDAGERRCAGGQGLLLACTRSQLPFQNPH